MEDTVTCSASVGMSSTGGVLAKCVSLLSVQINMYEVTLGATHALSTRHIHLRHQQLTTLSLHINVTSIANLDS